MNIAVIVLSMAGKLVIDANFGMIYIATAEIYPTTARVTALGLGSALARLGGALAPYAVLTVSYLLSRSLSINVCIKQFTSG